MAPGRFDGENQRRKNAKGATVVDEQQLKGGDFSFRILCSQYEKLNGIKEINFLEAGTNWFGHAEMQYSRTDARIGARKSENIVIHRKNP